MIAVSVVHGVLAGLLSVAMGLPGASRSPLGSRSRRRFPSSVACWHGCPSWPWRGRTTCR
jgi:hypothetical protein